jgi:cysteinyl-tRNA synthetase
VLKLLHDVFVDVLVEVAQIEQLVRMGADAAKAAKTVQDTGVREEVLKREKQALAAAFPAEFSTQVGVNKFFETVSAAAREFGVSAQELDAITDHRYYAALHYAAIGRRALAARAKAQEKVKDAPPVAAPKRAKAVPASNNRDAMAKLARSGSIRDAMRVDWD